VPSGWVTVNEEMATVPPAVMDTESRLISAPDVPTEKSAMVLPSESNARAQDAVPCEPHEAGQCQQ